MYPRNSLPFQNLNAQFTDNNIQTLVPVLRQTNSAQILFPLRSI